VPPLGKVNLGVRPHRIDAGVVDEDVCASQLRAARRQLIDAPGVADVAARTCYLTAGRDDRGFRLRGWLEVGQDEPGPIDPVTTASLPSCLEPVKCFLR
jgi:hypothetical protein